MPWRRAGVEYDQGFPGCANRARVRPWAEPYGTKAYSGARARKTAIIVNAANSGADIGAIFGDRAGLRSVTTLGSGTGQAARRMVAIALFYRQINPHHD
jgi:hypothetical protein